VIRVGEQLGQPRGDALGKRTCRVRVRSVAEHDVQEQDRVPRVVEDRREALVPDGRVDHRVGPTARVRVVSEVDHLVAAGSEQVAGVVLGFLRYPERLTQKHRRFGGQGAASVEALDPLLDGL